MKRTAGNVTEVEMILGAAQYSPSWADVKDALDLYASGIEVEVNPTDPAEHRWVFSDGSRVVAGTGDGWDIGFTTPPEEGAGCWCWASDGTHQEGCES